MKRHLILVVAILLYPFLLLAQTQSTAPAPSEAKPAPLAVAKPSAPKPYPVMSAAAKQRAREVSDYLIHAKTSLLYATFSPEMKKSSSTEKMAAFSRQLSTTLGTETKLVAEAFEPNMLRPTTVYTRLSQFSKSKAPVITAVSIDEQGLVDSPPRFASAPDVPPDAYANYKDKVQLRLPFQGNWMVYQGGRTLFDNGFAASEDSRYASVFVLLKDGSPFAEDATKNENFYCFGQPVLAPGEGTVVRVQDGYPDGQPGKPMMETGKGNYVVIAHGNSEFSVLSALKNGSTKVKRGDKVKAGDVLGQCGNSGSSSVPHVEYRLQNTRGLPFPNSLPAQFSNYTADGKVVELGEPTRGQMVANKE